MDVMTKLRQHYDVATKYLPAERIVGVFLYGSQNYGMDSETSDVDTKCIYVPSFEDIMNLNNPFNAEVRVGDDGGHMTFTDIREFVRQLRKQNPNTLEILFTKYYVRNCDFEEDWYKFYVNREKLAHYHPYAALNTMRHMTNRIYYHMTERNYPVKEFASFLRYKEMIYKYLSSPTYEEVFFPQNAEELKNVKYGVKKYTAQECKAIADAEYSKYNEYVDKLLTEDEPNLWLDRKVGELIYKLLHDLLKNYLKMEFENEN